MSTPDPFTPDRFQNVALTALDHARRGRRVLIVARHGYEAGLVIDTVANVLDPERDSPAVVCRSNGRWYATSRTWKREPDADRRRVASIDVVVAGTGQLRGRTGDVVLVGQGIRARRYLRDAALAVAGSAAPIKAIW